MLIRGSRSGHQAATFTPAETPVIVVRGSPAPWYNGTVVWYGRRDMGGSGQATTIELGMKVSVRRSGQNRIGVVTRVTGDYVGIRWTNSDFGETAEYQAHRDDVTPLAGWL